LEYALEYGTDCIEMHVDALRPKDRVVLIDDLMATGGTAAAAIELCRGLGAEVIGAGFVIELEFLNGRDRLGDVPILSLVTY
ncbi:MAG: adenine phosphoribosyltransferase, partial [Caldilineaceae bacterium]|nr:adenine phosphoribosyltransferase [Caldilineaceae bacterium]